MPSEGLRTFIAIVLSEEIKDFLVKLQEKLKASNADVKWVKKEGIHLTLKFLGNVEQKKIDEIIKIINNISNHMASFQLELGSIGAFPKKEIPRVIWVDLSKGDEETKAIAQKLEEEIAKLGIPKEKRAFSSHITLGRVKTSLNRKQLIEQLNYLQANPLKEKPKYKVEKITLFKSTLTPTGPIYQVLYEGNLKTN